MRPSLEEMFRLFEYSISNFIFVYFKFYYVHRTFPRELQNTMLIRPLDGALSAFGCNLKGGLFNPQFWGLRARGV